MVSEWRVDARVVRIKVSIEIDPPPWCDLIFAQSRLG
jgi:hypothetical protein